MGTSPKAILERAGAGQGSMDHHFKGKANLAPAAVRRTSQEMRATAQGVLGGSGTPYEPSTVQCGHVPARASGSPAAFDAGVRGPLSRLRPTS